ncbi:MAG TPA: hypothetical protein VGO00_10105, partial [Kofleriaceae bacterium]|nr:hypothetical protein [Kofleriaceae bacterium]
MADPIHYDLEDVEPEIREPTAAEKKRETRAVMSKHGIGEFEKLAMAETGDLAAPLHIDAKIRHDAGAELGAYQDGYNNYTVPWRATLRAMGRARDLGLTGANVNPQMADAPTTPDQMSPRLAKRFRKLSLTHDQQALSAFASWSTAQSALQVDAEKVLSGQQILRGAMESYRSVQMMLAQRKLEARRAGELGQIAAIDHAAEVCARIVEVGGEALTGAAEIDEALEAHGAIEEGEESEGGD